MRATTESSPGCTYPFYRCSDGKWWVRVPILYDLFRCIHNQSFPGPPNAQVSGRDRAGIGDKALGDASCLVTAWAVGVEQVNVALVGEAAVAFLACDLA